MKAKATYGNKLEKKTGQMKVDMVSGKAVKKSGGIVPTSLKYGGKSC